LGFCAVGAGVVYEFVYCGLRFVRVVAVLVNTYTQYTWF
jgi:hypothetical protein